MMAEIALLQRISVFLGHPVYALSVVLFSLILSTGVGSLASERIPLDSGPKLIGWSALVGLYLLALPSGFLRSCSVWKVQACWSEPAWLFSFWRRSASSWASVFRPECGLSRWSTRGRPRGSGASMARRVCSPQALPYDQHRVRHRHDASSRGGLLLAAARTRFASRQIGSSSATVRNPKLDPPFGVVTCGVRFIAH